MRVLIFTQYYPPEVGATQNRMQYFAAALAALGHHVTVITEVPNHPAGIIAPEFRGVLWRRTTEDGVTVIRVWVKTAAVKTFLVRIGFYVTYAINALLAALFLAGRRYDVVFATSPPLTVGWPGYVYSKLRRVPFVLDVRDLWPVLAVELGEMKNRRAVALARRLELLLYRNAARVTAVTKGFVRYVAEQGYPVERIVLLPNGTIPEVFHPAPRDEAQRRAMGLEGRFVVGFYGNHGIAQDLENVLEAANLLRDDPRFVFLFVGEGPVKAALLARQQELRLQNVVFHPQVPQGSILPLILQADAVLVPLRRLELFKTFIPSKLFDFMACAKPIVLQVDGEAREILEEAGAGVFVEPGRPDALAAALAKLADGPAAELERMGMAGLRYVRANYLREEQAKRLVEVLEGLVSR
ncbi:MAG TPA: glycosyltransferase family 4 protein [Vicinamibacterales bacterium]|nr:glycosyltransferase family 4 protein [Vicinamibacterales bacterium]